mmetsp:Transcript_3347/g.9349  ORF Transcript_3347/g.9349 Transcript_3347/m.9349 type:complete len:376 (+) Transcript_3347:30-1157(+)
MFVCLHVLLLNVFGIDELVATSVLLLCRGRELWREHPVPRDVPLVHDLDLPLGLVKEHEEVVPEELQALHRVLDAHGDQVHLLLPVDLEVLLLLGHGWRGGLRGQHVLDGALRLPPHAGLLLEQGHRLLVVVRDENLLGVDVLATDVAERVPGGLLLLVLWPHSVAVPHALRDGLLLELPQLPLHGPPGLVDGVVRVVGLHLRPDRPDRGEHGDLGPLELGSLGLVLGPPPRAQPDVHPGDRGVLPPVHVVVVQHQVHRGLLHLGLHVPAQGLRHLEVPALDVELEGVRVRLRVLLLLRVHQGLGSSDSRPGDRDRRRGGGGRGGGVDPGPFGPPGCEPSGLHPRRLDPPASKGKVVAGKGCDSPRGHRAGRPAG